MSLNDQKKISLINIKVVLLGKIKWLQGPNPSRPNLSHQRDGTRMIIIIRPIPRHVIDNINFQPKKKKKKRKSKLILGQITSDHNIYIFFNLDGARYGAEMLMNTSWAWSNVSTVQIIKSNNNSFKINGNFFFFSNTCLEFEGAWLHPNVYLLDWERF